MNPKTLLRIAGLGTQSPCISRLPGIARQAPSVFRLDRKSLRKLHSVRVARNALPFLFLTLRERIFPFISEFGTRSRFRNSENTIIIMPCFLFQDNIGSLPEDMRNKLESSPLFFTRTRGLFRECFLGEKRNAPKDGEISELKKRFASVKVANKFMSRIGRPSGGSELASPIPLQSNTTCPCDQV